MPLVLDTLHGRVLATLRKASALRRALATALLAAAVGFVRARRVTAGVALQHALAPPPLLALAAAWLRRLLLAPLYALAQLLVAKKVREWVGARWRRQAPSCGLSYRLSSAQPRAGAATAPCCRDACRRLAPPERRRCAQPWASGGW